MLLGHEALQGRESHKERGKVLNALAMQHCLASDFATVPRYFAQATLLYSFHIVLRRCATIRAASLLFAIDDVCSSSVLITPWHRVS